jgi:glycosyltransferase involved in cell wall biosynthesis
LWLLYQCVYSRRDLHDMTIDCYTICWNEEAFLPYFLRHYRHFCRNIFVLDNESDDNSRDICREAGATVIDWKTDGQQDNEAMRSIKNTCWKGSDADYVVVCDIDEIVCGLDKLGPSRGRVVRCAGWQMVGNGQPPEQIRLATPDGMFCKCSVFSPAITEIGYNHGCHVSNPVGHSVIADNLCNMLHYGMLSMDSMLHRWSRYAARASESDRRNHWGQQYYDPVEMQKERYRTTLARAVSLPVDIYPHFHPL